MDKTVPHLIQILKEKKLTLALAESMTCGLAAHKLSTSPGTSEVLVGSIVCYSPHVKKHILGISKHMIKIHTCESQEVTDAMTKNLSKIITADVYAGITGLASAGGSETKAKPVGTVFFSIVYNEKLFSKKQKFTGTPKEIKKKACIALYKLILQIIKR